MNDLISRQEAIESICTEGTRLERNGTVAMAEIKQWCVDILEALPSAQRWIPVTEQLPEQNRWYLISNGLDSWVAIWSSKDKQWLSVTGFDYTIADVIAWMEFPEPYEPPKEET